MPCSNYYYEQVQILNKHGIIMDSHSLITINLYYRLSRVCTVYSYIIPVVILIITAGLVVITCGQ